MLATTAGLVALLNTTAGLSLLWGWSVSLLPSACFAWFGFRKFDRARQAGAMVFGLYRAEVFKFCITVALFAAVFTRVEEIYPAVFFLAYVCGQVGSWLVTAQALSRHRY